MNAQVGLDRPGVIGADVCHLESAQDFLHPAWRRRPRRRADRRRRTSRAVPSGDILHRRPRPRKRRVGAVSAAPWGSASICTHLVDVYPHDGRERSDRGDEECAILNANYIAKTAGTVFSDALHRPRAEPVAHECILDLRQFQRQRGITGRRRGQATDGLRISRAHDELAGCRNADGRTDRERIPGGTRSLLRRDDFDPSGNPGGRARDGGSPGQCAQKRAAHGEEHLRRRLEPSLQPRAGRRSRLRGCMAQILAAGGTHRQCPWRQTSCLLVPPSRGVRGVSGRIARPAAAMNSRLVAALCGPAVAMAACTSPSRADSRLFTGRARDAGRVPSHRGSVSNPSMVRHQRARVPWTRSPRDSRRHAGRRIPASRRPAPGMVDA